MILQQVIEIVKEHEPNTRQFFWPGDRPGSYAIILPHNERSFTSDDAPEDRTSLCSIHIFNKDPRDKTYLDIFKDLIKAKIAVDDPVSDYSEIEELNQGGWIHHIIDCRIFI